MCWLVGLLCYWLLLCSLCVSFRWGVDMACDFGGFVYCLLDLCLLVVLIVRVDWLLLQAVVVLNVVVLWVIWLLLSLDC